MTDMFETQEDIDPDKDYLEEFVGEGKKYKDEKELAKSKAFGDLHIKRLEEENRFLREQTAKNKTLEEFVDQLSRTKAASDEDDDTTNNRSNQDVLNLQQLETVFDKRLDQYEVKRQRSANAELVKSELTKVYGKNYVPKLDSVAQELGLTREEMSELAQNRPQLFLKTVLPAKQVDEDFVPPVSSINAKSSLGQTKRTQQYYKDLKNKDFKTWSSAKTQIQMHDDALKLGEAFFDVG